VKTPMCRALKKINNIEGNWILHIQPSRILIVFGLFPAEAQEGAPKLPNVVALEIRPRSGVAFARVQSLAQNPRIRANMSIQRRLSSLIKLLQKKWKPLNEKKVRKRFLHI
jgi:hypothetical protein